MVSFRKAHRADKGSPSASPRSDNPRAAADAKACEDLVVLPLQHCKNTQPQPATLEALLAYVLRLAITFDPRLEGEHSMHLGKSYSRLSVGTQIQRPR